MRACSLLRVAVATRTLQRKGHSSAEASPTATSTAAGLHADWSRSYSANSRTPQGLGSFRTG